MSAGFSADAGWDFELRIALGEARSGATDPGEILAAVDGLPPGDHEGWLRAWVDLAERILVRAEVSREAGRRVSAASGFLRAASYTARAVSAAAAEEDDHELLPLFRAHRQAWEAFLDHADLDVARIQIPLPDATVAMPGWVISPAGMTGRQPLIIGINGSDGSLTSMWSAIASPALERGYRVLLFDGPGQQSMLFEHEVPFRANWGPVLSAVTDVALARPDVDRSRVAAYGISQAGYWLPEALATEHRLVAAIADPGVVEVVRSWTAHLPEDLLQLFRDGRRAEFDEYMTAGMTAAPEGARTWRFRARPYLAGGPFDTLTAVARLDSHDVLPHVTTPLLVADPEDEQFWPGQSAELTALVPTATLMPFSAAEGANWHCQPLGRAVFEQRAFDWLDTELRRR